MELERYISTLLNSKMSIDIQKGQVFDLSAFLDGLKSELPEQKDQIKMKKSKNFFENIQGVIDQVIDNNQKPLTEEKDVEEFTLNFKSFEENRTELDAYRETKEPWAMDDQNFKNCTSVSMVQK